jgi:hypothetical protein
VVNDRPLPSVKEMTLVLGSSACALTCTSDTWNPSLSTINDSLALQHHYGITTIQPINYNSQLKQLEEIV